MKDDLIRRSDAIDAIEYVTWYHQNRNKDMVEGANSDEHQAWYRAEDVYEALKAVPSADHIGDSTEMVSDKDPHTATYIQALKNRIKELEADRPSGWIPCSERLPEVEEKVWIQTERGNVCFAMYEDGTISEEDSRWCWYDLPFEKWDEKNDCGIIPEGWWEWTEFHPDDEFDCPVDEEVVAWMPLPSAYQGE